MVKHSLNFVLLMYDDFSGELLTGPEYRFQVNGRMVHPLRKPEGFFVFNGLEWEAEYTVEILSVKYRSRRICVENSGADPPSKVRDVRLLRNGNYHFPDCDFLKGQCLSGTEVFAFSKTESKTFRLQSAVNGGKSDRIFLLGFGKRTVAPLRYALGAGKTREIFLLRNRNSDGSYQTEPRLLHTHKAGESFIRTYYDSCGEDGSFAVPVAKGEGRPDSIEFYNKESKKWDCLSAEALS